MVLSVGIVTLVLYKPVMEAHAKWEAGKTEQPESKPAQAQSNPPADSSKGQQSQAKSSGQSGNAKTKVNNSPAGVVNQQGHDNSAVIGNSNNISFNTSPCIQGQPREVDGPDAYKAVCSLDLADWVLKEADRLELMANQCKYDGSGQGLAKSGDSFSDVMWRFNQTLDECCSAKLKQLRKEVIHRLGPSYVDTKEQSEWQMLFMDDAFPRAPNQPPRQVDCMQLQDYVPHLRKLGRQLKRTLTPRAAPKPLHFVMERLPPQPGQFLGDFGLLVTITTDAPVAGGYIVTEFTSGVTVSETDIGSEFMSGYTPVDNEPLTNYLDQFSREHHDRVITVDLPEDVFGPSKPVHLTLYAAQSFSVDKVTLFDE